VEEIDHFLLDAFWWQHSSVAGIVISSFLRSLYKLLPFQPTAGPLLLSPETLGLMPSSPLLRMLLLLDRLLPLRISLGSFGCSPLALANRFSTSVRLITPTKTPLMLAPGIALAEIEGALGAVNGDAEFEDTPWELGGGEGAIRFDCAEGEEMEEPWDEVGTKVAGWVEGVGGPEEDGDAVSVIHNR